MSAIVSNEHRKDLENLVKDPLVQDMAIGLRDVPDEKILDDEGQPTWDFMTAANEQYRSNGGQHGKTIGAVAQALVQIRKERGQHHIPAFVEPFLVLIDEGDRLKILFENSDITVDGIKQHHPNGWAQYVLLMRLCEAGFLNHKESK